MQTNIKLLSLSVAISLVLTVQVTITTDSVSFQDDNAFPQCNARDVTFSFSIDVNVNAVGVLFVLNHYLITFHYFMIFILFGYHYDIIVFGNKLICFLTKSNNHTLSFRPKPQLRCVQMFSSTPFLSESLMADEVGSHPLALSLQHQI